MVTLDSIVELSGRIAREFQPERIILFGSHACGTTAGESDVDLFSAGLVFRF